MCFFFRLIMLYIFAFRNKFTECKIEMLVHRKEKGENLCKFIKIGNLHWLPTSFFFIIFKNCILFFLFYFSIRFSLFNDFSKNRICKYHYFYGIRIILSNILIFFIYFFLLTFIISIIYLYISLSTFSVSPIFILFQFLFFVLCLISLNILTTVLCVIPIFVYFFAWFPWINNFIFSLSEWKTNEEQTYFLQAYQKCVSLLILLWAIFPLEKYQLVYEDTQTHTLTH